MNNKRKVALLILLVGAMLIALVGCGVPSEAKRERKLKKLLNDKYGEEFEIRESFVNSGVHAWCYPVNDPSLVFEIDTPTKMDKIGMDSYLQTIVERQISEQQQAQVEDSFGGGFISVDIPLGGTENYQNPKSSDINYVELLDYIHSERLSDQFFVIIFCNDIRSDANKEYEYICELGNMYSSGSYSEMILEIYYVDEAFIEEAKQLLEKYGWTIALGSDSRYDIWDLTENQERIIIYYDEDGKPYIGDLEKEEKTALDLTKYQNIRMDK